ncbi:MAG: ABC transporter permease [Candidatus Neomicrothrix subdominans]
MILRLTLRSARAHILRFLLTTFAVLIGVTFITTAYGLADQLRSILDEETSGAGALGDVGEIPGANRLLFVSPELTSFGFGGSLDAALVDEIDGIDGVASAVGQSQRGVAFGVPGRRVDALGAIQSSATTSAFDEARWKLTSGTAPKGPDQLAVNSDGLSAADAQVGDTASVFLPTGRRDMTITGVVSSVTPESSSLFTFTSAVAVFDPAVNAQLFGGGNRIDSILVAVAPDADVATVSSAIEANLPSGITVGDAEDLTGQVVGLINTIVDGIETGMLVFAGITLFVGTFLVANTFSIVVAQRTRELAVLRAVGAGRRQVFVSVLGEAAVIGLIASLLGLAAGLALSTLAGWAIDTDRGFELIVSGRTVGIGFGIGLGVTLLSALFPALKAIRVSPVAAMRDTESDPSRSGLSGLLMGLLALGVGLTGIVIGLGGGRSTPQRIALIGGGAIVMFLALAALSRVIAAPAVRLIGAPLGSGPVPTLARTNAARNPKRTATTASALMIGLALIALVATVGLSVRQSLENQLRNNTTATWYLVPNQFVPPDPAAITDALSGAEGVAAVVPSSFANATVEGPAGKTTGVAVARLSEVGEVYDLNITDGPSDGGVWLSSDAADNQGVGQGDRVTVSTGTGAETTATVGAIYTRTAALSDIIIDERVADEVGAQAFVQAIAIKATPDTSPAALKASIEPVAADFANAEVITPRQFEESQTGPLDIAVKAVAALLLASVLVAGLGVANTLALSVYERTREIGLLRAVGMTRRQIRKTVRREAVITSVFGGLLGVVVGTALGSAAVKVLPDSLSNTLVIPWLWIIACIMFTMLMGLLAALWPAWRAARMNVLDAISHE